MISFAFTAHEYEVLMSGNRVDRREFLATGVGLASAALTGSTVGASPNDRIRLGIVGCGARGTYLLHQAIAAAPGQLEIVALCDVWSLARETMAALVAEKLPGQKPRLVSRHQDLLETPSLDGVIIATPDFSHPGVLIDTVRAGKDAFVEKPLSARLEDAVAALDAVEASRQIVQVGTQRRSNPQFLAAAEYVKSGALGPICKIETAWNRNVPSWRRPIDVVKEEDVDWEQYLMYHPKQAFDPQRFRCWQWYYEYTTGLVGLLGSHMIDVALWIMNDPFPLSAVALGDILTWKDGRQISDTAEYVFEFPKGWLLTFSSRLGSGPESDYEIFYGQERTLDSRDWISRPAANTRPDGATDTPLPAQTVVEHGHVGNWLDCMRSRQTPNAPIQAGYAHAVACCLGREAERTGRKMRYDATTRRIIEATDTRSTPSANL
jgi:predicted dehydrogenase